MSHDTYNVIMCIFFKQCCDLYYCCFIICVKLCPNYYFSCVNIGSLSNPKNIPGLAHLCEHMLFMGTKKYPEENEFSQFITQNGGNYSAYTAMDHTNYHCSSNTDSL